MTLQAGKMYRPTDVAFDAQDNTVYVVEQFNHRVSKWNYTPGEFTFTIDAGAVTAVNVGGGGANYNIGDPVVIGPPTSTTIANPVNATAEVETINAGEILTVKILIAGSGYEIGFEPTAVADESTGSGASLTTTVATPWGNNVDGTTGQGGPVDSLTDNNLNLLCVGQGGEAQIKSNSK